MVVDNDGSRISGFRFNRVTGTDGNASINLRGAVNFRVDNNYFDNADYLTQWAAAINADAFYDNSYPRPTGVIDNNYINKMKIAVFGPSNFARQNAFWVDASLIGTGNTVYFEDNTIDRGNVGSVLSDSNYAGSYVIRYNTLIGGNCMVHSLQGAAERGTQSWEIYGNAWSFPDTAFYNIAFLRGGTGMVFNNTVTGPRSSYAISIDNVRSKAGSATNNCYVGNETDAGLCNGSSPWDGNEAVTAAIYGDTGSGTASENNAGILLTDSTKSWTPDAFISANINYNSPTGNHTGDDSQTTLTKAAGTNWVAGSLLLLYVRNTTDGSGGVITANTATTVTCSLTGGSDNTWQSGDAYEITEGITVWNTTTGAKGLIFDNTGTTVSHQPLTGGTRQTWEAGDAYKITDGWPCRDQIGRGVDSALFDTETYAASTSEPVYCFNNMDGEDVVSVAISNYTGNWIQADRDYFDYDASFDGSSGTGMGTYAQMSAITPTTTGVGFWVTDRGEWNSENAGYDGQLYYWDGNSWEIKYTPYTYPHPLRGEGNGHSRGTVLLLP